MRLHSLEVSGFLAYGASATIDFDHLTEAGFFLIHGETGAGKTTLLDAISFAIYGRLPGAREGVKTIRSDHADPATPTRVVLDASVGDARVRITRSPRYDRPKVRGSGTTSELAKVAVERYVGGTWEPLTSSADEAGSYLRQWIGLDADQFFRLVLIPQGAFAGFLHASSKDRSKVLAELFRADLVVYQRVQDWFKEQLAKADAHRNAAASELDKERARIAQVLQARGVTDADVTDVEWLDARMRELDAELDAARASQAVAGAALDQASADLADGEQVVQASQRFAKARDERDAAVAAWGGFRAANIDALPLDSADGEVEPTLEALASRAAQQLQAAVDANAAVDDIVQARTALQGLIEGAESAQAEADTWRAALHGCDARIKELEVTIADGVEAAKALAPIVRLETEAAARLTHATSRDTAQAHALGARHAVDAAAAEALRCREELSAARAAVRMSQASQLARELVPGAPCPVCGATDHPAPHGDGDAIDATLLDAAEEAVRKAEGVLADRRVDLASAEATVQSHRVALAHRADATHGMLATELADIQREHAALDTQVKAGDAARAAFDATRVERETAAAALEALAQRQVDAAARIADARIQVASLEQSAGVAPGAPVQQVPTGPLQDAVDRAANLRASARALLDRLGAAKAALDAVGADVTGELPNLIALRDAVEAAKQASAAADAAVQHLDRDVAALAKRREQLHSCVTRLADSGAHRARLGAIAEPVNGKGPGKTLLTDYYLAARLRQVLDRANGRLLRMTDNRFTFTFDADAKGSGYQSLAIAVHDAWSGSSRPVSSLSGGETFTASLALALGLADIVEAEAGGRALDSLFIDEGFGTLSSEYLNRVMQDLEQLRASGRLVGIISHVTELRQRIPMQLAVSRGLSGSTVALVDADLDGV